MLLHVQTVLVHAIKIIKSLWWDKTEFPSSWWWRLKHRSGCGRGGGREHECSQNRFMNHDANIVKFMYFLHQIELFIPAITLHMPRQLSCRGMCKFVAWLHHYQHWQINYFHMVLNWRAYKSLMTGIPGYCGSLFTGFQVTGATWGKHCVLMSTQAINRSTCFIARIHVHAFGLGVSLLW